MTPDHWVQNQHTTYHQHNRILKFNLLRIRNNQWRKNFPTINFHGHVKGFSIFPSPQKPLHAPNDTTFFAPHSSQSMTQKRLKSQQSIDKRCIGKPGEPELLRGIGAFGWVLTSLMNHPVRIASWMMVTYDEEKQECRQEPWLIPYLSQPTRKPEIHKQGDR